MSNSPFFLIYQFLISYLNISIQLFVQENIHFVVDEKLIALPIFFIVKFAYILLSPTLGAGRELFITTELRTRSGFVFCKVDMLFCKLSPL